MERGNITTHKAGVATITVTTGGPNKDSDKVTITVLPKGEASIVITNAPTHPLKKGSTHNLGYLYMDEEEISHTQENAPVDVTWEQGTSSCPHRRCKWSSKGHWNRYLHRYRNRAQGSRKQHL